MITKKPSKETELKQEIKQWKETCEILSNKDVINSIKISLKQIAQGKGIPISQL